MICQSEITISTNCCEKIVSFQIRDGTPYLTITEGYHDSIYPHININLSSPKNFDNFCKMLQNVPVSRYNNVVREQKECDCLSAFHIRCDKDREMRVYVINNHLCITAMERVFVIDNIDDLITYLLERFVNGRK